MVRSAGNIAVQIGVESTSGTAVSANKRLMGLTLDPHAAIETVQHRPSGYKVPTASSVSTDITEADFEGPIDYQNIIYPLASLFGAPVTTQPNAEDVASAHQHVFTFTGKGSVTPKTFTVEVGDASRAVKFTYGAFTSVELSIDPTGENTMSGSMVGRSLQTGTSLSQNATEIEIMPVNGSHWNVYADSKADDLGKTKLLQVYEAGLTLGDMLSQEFTINSANNGGFNALFDAEEPNLEWNMTLAADATAEAYLTSLRNGGKAFIRLEAVGPVIGEDVRYGIQIDMCVLVTDVESYESNDGKYVLPITFALAYDAEWGKALTITVTNTLASL